MKLLLIFKKIFFEASLLVYGEYNSYKIYGRFLGVNFGKNVRITGRVDFGSEPYLINIGDNVTITKGIRFITHDGGVGLFRKEYPGINIFGKISVHNNVFIGTDTLILPNVTIGNNVIIGSGSLVSKSIPDNVVVAGVPVRIIRSISEYKDNVIKKAFFITETNPRKRKKLILDELNKKLI